MIMFYNRFLLFDGGFAEERRAFTIDDRLGKTSIVTRSCGRIWGSSKGCLYMNVDELSFMVLCVIRFLPFTRI